MSNLSEEEIIKEINIIKETLINILNYDLNTYKEDIYNLDTKQVFAIFGLLDLYNKEKEKVDRLQKENEELKKYKNKHSLVKRHYISIDKIKELLEELKRPDYLDYEYYRTIDYVAEKLGIELED